MATVGVAEVPDNTVSVATDVVTHSHSHVNVVASCHDVHGTVVAGGLDNTVSVALGGVGDGLGGYSDALHVLDDVIATIPGASGAIASMWLSLSVPTFMPSEVRLGSLASPVYTLDAAALRRGLYVADFGPAHHQ